MTVPPGVESSAADAFAETRARRARLVRTHLLTPQEAENKNADDEGRVPLKIKTKPMSWVRDHAGESLLVGTMIATVGIASVGAATGVFPHAPESSPTPAATMLPNSEQNGQGQNFIGSPEFLLAEAVSAGGLLVLLALALRSGRK